MYDLAYFRSLYEAFNARDLDALLARLSEDVDWPNAWKGGRLRGRPAVRSYWSEQWAQIDPRVEPIAVHALSDGRLAVTVRQVVRTHDGLELSDAEVVHNYRLEDGLIKRMDVDAPA
jgi:hypothetical protein